MNFKKSLKETCAFGTNIPAIRSKKLSKKNTSGVTGVFRDKRNGKWCATITFQGYTYRLGRYAEKQAAIESRAAAEKKRDEFIFWYDSLTNEERENYINEYKNNAYIFKELLNNRHMI